MALSKADKLKLCAGCHNNFYNGNNDRDIKECWNLAHAKVVQRVKVSYHQEPPFDPTRTIKVLSCCHYDGYALLEPNCYGFTWLTPEKKSKVGTKP